MNSAQFKLYYWCYIIGFGVYFLTDPKIMEVYSIGCFISKILQCNACMYLLLVIIFIDAICSYCFKVVYILFFHFFIFFLFHIFFTSILTVILSEIKCLLYDNLNFI